jgi:hypothetical protein
MPTFVSRNPLKRFKRNWPHKEFEESLQVLACFPKVEPEAMSAAETRAQKRKRHRPEEIIKKLREPATLLAGGQGVEAVCKNREVSVPTYHRWKE